MWTNRRKKADITIAVQSGVYLVLSLRSRRVWTRVQPNSDIRAFRMRRCDAFTTLSINRFLARKPRASHCSTVVRETQSSPGCAGFSSRFLFVHTCH